MLGCRPGLFPARSSGIRDVGDGVEASGRLAVEVRPRPAAGLGRTRKKSHESEAARRTQIRSDFRWERLERRPPWQQGGRFLFARPSRRHASIGMDNGEPPPAWGPSSAAGTASLRAVRLTEALAAAHAALRTTAASRHAADGQVAATNSRSRRHAPLLRQRMAAAVGALGAFGVGAYQQLARAMTTFAGILIKRHGASLREEPQVGRTTRAF